MLEKNRPFKTIFNFFPPLETENIEKQNKQMNKKEENVRIMNIRVYRSRRKWLRKNLRHEENVKIMYLFENM